MRKVLWYSILLIAGLIASQFLAGRGHRIVELLTMLSLSFLVIRLGYGFEIARDKPQQYFWDWVVGTTTTIFPWLFCAVYFVFAMAPAELWHSRDLWWESVILARFAAPTSVGLLFSMLAAAELSGTWIYKKARILAIFDDLDTILLFVPLKTLFVSGNARMVVLVVVIMGLVWAAWKFVRGLKLPVSWPWVMIYSAIIVAVSEAINYGSKAIDDTAPISIEVLLLAFVMGCLLARSPERRDQTDDVPEARGQGLDGESEKFVTTLISACFMALAGLSMPVFVSIGDASMHEVATRRFVFEGVPPAILADKNQFPGSGVMVLHVLFITLLLNIGKMFPALCYRKEASRKERLALAIGMFPRGEVGAGMLVLSVSYGIAGPALSVAVLSLALNLMCSGLLVFIIKRLASKS
jgi:Kef-type K+ transport system membrane component KefB